MVHGLWTLAEAAAFLGIGPGTLYAWVRMGRVPYLRQGDLVLLRIEDVEAPWGEWLEADPREREGAPARLPSGS